MSVLGRAISGLGYFPDSCGARASWRMLADAVTGLSRRGGGVVARPLRQLNRELSGNSVT